MRPPKDDLLKKIFSSRLTLREGDILAITSKVISIDEGRCVRQDQKTKDELVMTESSKYLPRSFTPGGYGMHTITNGMLALSAGIDASNSGNFYTLWPKNPTRSAKRLLTSLKRHYKLKKLGLIITDSHSILLRRGVIGFALSFAGFQPLIDYRGSKDLFGRVILASQTNVPDALGAAAVFAMGEGSEQTPLARIRGAVGVSFSKPKKKPKDSFIVPMKEDLYGPFFSSAPWRKGKK